MLNFLIIVVTLLVANTATAFELDELWTVDGFKEPESATIDLERNVIYVSNVNGYALDDNGFISRVSMNGKVVDHAWITGINSPTGTAITNNRLYFADVDSLVVVDINNATILSRIPAPDAAASPSLNDVAIGPEGTVYVSGSRSRKIYIMVNNELQVWKHDPVRLKNANGLLVQENALIHGGQTWSVFSRSTGKLLEGAHSPSQLTNFDGIMHDGKGHLVTTTIDDPRLWLITPNVTRPISEQQLNGIDMDVKSGYLALPRVGGKLSLFMINQTHSKPAH